MRKVDIAKRIIKENFDCGDCGLFYTRNITGDDMETIYDKDGLTIDICYEWSYFEVFGLTVEEFKELSIFYGVLKRKMYDELFGD